MTDEERVRQLAYSIWEAEGRPEGQQQRHWDRALKIVAAEQAAGNDADLEEVGEPLDETPILEEDLPLEDDEVGIQENRLPLEDPDGDPDFDEAPFRDDTVVGQDVPVQDRGHPPQAPTDPDATASSMEPLPEDSATVVRTRRPRRSSDPLAASKETSTAKTANTSKKAGKTATAKKTDAKTTKKATPKAKKTNTPKTSDPES
ncbi:DUF2934 domain-containing protein [Vreelandella maris]|uniref:DUF2934 domain-containing protein n=1 Tax=Vreelandella maris TaxID=2729617 RepID=UPI0030ECDBF2